MHEHLPSIQLSFLVTTALMCHLSPPFAEEFTHSFSIFERKEFHCPVYNDKASFIIELIKCSLLCLLTFNQRKNCRISPKRTRNRIFPAKRTIHSNVCLRTMSSEQYKGFALELRNFDIRSCLYNYSIKFQR